MSYGGWYSKKDVIKDLKKAMGNQAFDLDEGSVLVGEQPPPRPYNVLDEEAELQLARLNGGSEPTTTGDICPPDLAGITQMLRMVDELSENETKPGLPITKESPKNVLTISKLDPTVKKFFPTSNISNEKSSVKEAIADGNGTLKTDRHKNHMIKTENFDKFTLGEGRVDTSQLTDEEIKQMRDKLKSKIGETSQAACVKVKRERNLAIATLLKLYCQTPKVADEQKPALMSPAYFQKSKCNDPIDNSSSKEITIEKNSRDKACYAEEFSLQKPSMEPQQSGSIPKDLKNSSDIAASVDKVHKWFRDFNDDETPTVPDKIDSSSKKHDETNSNADPTDKQKGSVYLGAITFKRKACNSKSDSPSFTESAESKKLENEKSPKCVEYKPSAYAEELTKKYQEHSQVQDDIKQDFWALLESKLKAKDEEIRKKRATEAAAEPEEEP